MDDAQTDAPAVSPPATLEAVIHELRHGDASEGNTDDIAWCASQLEGLAALASPRVTGSPEKSDK